MDIQLDITLEMLKLIAEIDEFKGCWQVLENLAPERLDALKKVATIESVGSSTRIEGAKLSDREVEELLASIKTQTFASRDEQEVAGYADTMEKIFANFKNITLTENHVKYLHQILLQYSTKDERHRGEYKKFPNHVEAFGPDGKSLGIVFATATPFETPAKMTALFKWFNEAEKKADYHPLLRIGIFIVTFLAIHPFQDGNGRLSRILTTLLLLRSGYGYVPYSSMENVIELNKEAYYKALRRTQTTIYKESQNWQPWLVFFLTAMKKQKDNLAKKTAQEKLLQEASVPELSLQILQLAKEHGRITVKNIEHLTHANRNTIKSHLKKLVDSNQLARHGKGRGVWYTLAIISGCRH